MDSKKALLTVTKEISLNTAETTSLRKVVRLLSGSFRRRELYQKQTLSIAHVVKPEGNQDIRA